MGMPFKKVLLKNATLAGAIVEGFGLLTKFGGWQMMSEPAEISIKWSVYS